MNKNITERRPILEAFTVTQPLPLSAGVSLSRQLLGRAGVQTVTSSLVNHDCGRLRLTAPVGRGGGSVDVCWGAIGRERMGIVRA